jgi:excisionase family DNA binding protein
MTELDDRWLSVTEIAKYLGASNDSVYRWIEKHAMPAHRVGRAWKFKKDEVDAWIRSGGASDGNKERRAKFIELVLRQAGFGVDRSRDLVTAWFRRYPQEDSKKALECLGRLMVCARQLDAILNNDKAIAEYADAFLKKEFNRFI